MANCSLNAYQGVTYMYLAHRIQGSDFNYMWLLEFWDEGLEFAI